MRRVLSFKTNESSWKRRKVVENSNSKFVTCQIWRYFELFLDLFFGISIKKVSLSFVFVVSVARVRFFCFLTKNLQKEGFFSTNKPQKSIISQMFGRLRWIANIVGLSRKLLNKWCFVEERVLFRGFRGREQNRRTRTTETTKTKLNETFLMNIPKNKSQNVSKLGIGLILNSLFGRLPGVFRSSRYF